MANNAARPKHRGDDVNAKSVGKNVAKDVAKNAKNNAKNVAKNYAVVTQIAVARGPIGEVVMGSAGGSVLTVNSADRSMSVFNARALAVQETVLFDADPVCVAVTDDHVHVGTSSAGSDGVTLLDAETMTVAGAYPLAFSVRSLVASPDGKRVYVGRTGSDHMDDHADVAVIDPIADRVGTIDVARGPGINVDAMCVDSSGTRLYVAATDVRGSRLVVINTETARVQRTIRIGAPIRDIALGPDHTVYLLTSDRARGGAVAVVNLVTRQISDVVALGGAPTQLTMSPDGSYAYIVDYDDVAVLCTDTHQVVHSIQVGAPPSGVAVSADGAHLYISDYAGRVTVVSASSTMPLLYSQILTAQPRVMAGDRLREPATV